MAQDAPRGVGGLERRDQPEPTAATATRQHIHGEHAPHQIGPAPAATIAGGGGLGGWMIRGRHADGLRRGRRYHSRRHAARGPNTP